ncbi:MAG TPA: VanZ family protein [Terracidiphilus sp.]|nr:VanZ family protein [Terracidiphilus sp.]
MSSSARGLKFWLSAWLPVLLGIAVIALESTVWFGADHTSRPLRAIFQALFGRVSDAHWEIIHHAIRKSGHFVGYGLIGVAWLRAWWMTLPRSHFLSDAVLALVGTALIASCDEWHQAFLPNRTGTPWDVLLDCCGAITLELLAYLILRSLRPGRLAHAA